MNKDPVHSTSDKVPRSNHKGDDSFSVSREGTMPSASGFSETVSIERLTEGQVESTAVDTILDWPLPSKPTFTVRGKTVTKWSIDRRRIAKSLLKKWSEATKNIASAGFAVCVGGLVKEIEQQMPNFRDIPGEDAFAGILQLLCNVLSGENFRILQEKKLNAPIDEIFVMLASQEKVNLALYQAILEKLVAHGFVCQAM